ncbi:MAG: HPr family phosphocarrier protein [Lawsonibacter sp.]|nr:HPr family phosphocarrier protein [Lawsonibacter sp.]
MKQFEYTVTNPVGIHARPAGLLVQTVKALDSAVTIGKTGGPSASAARLIALMGLDIRQRDTVLVTVEGSSEEADAAFLERFFQENL